MNITIRLFRKSDISKKVEWINNPENNTYLHYDIPLSVEKTEKWFDNKVNSSRYDAVIEVDGIPCGLIGLLSIDEKNKKAEYYVMIGEKDYKGKGVSVVATQLILKYAFITLTLNKVYLYTETENIPAQKLFQKVGFVKEGLIRQDVFSKGRYVDRYVYGICRNEYLER